MKKEIVVCADFFITCKKTELPKIYKRLRKALKDLKLDESRSGISFYEKIAEENL